MGKDRQEARQRKEGRVQSDRDQSFAYKGGATLESAEEARKRQRKK
ncbi:YpzI-like protein [Evansella caseinilytica]|uniref:YpzI-like protein n=1 Tax=Evansella caseinilytica TaxID=1503961 RepID=A0A1H3NCF2_9BACI|nr:YpzI family protein [Evansella caseinilytica]SDY86444.1 YpzI-like protein [Evansella caseinilytica]